VFVERFDEDTSSIMSYNLASNDFSD